MFFILFICKILLVQNSFLSVNDCFWKNILFEFYLSVIISLIFCFLFLVFVLNVMLPLSCIYTLLLYFYRVAPPRLAFMLIVVVSINKIFQFNSVYLSAWFVKYILYYFSLILVKKKKLAQAVSWILNKYYWYHFCIKVGNHISIF